MQRAPRQRPRRSTTPSIGTFDRFDQPMCPSHAESPEATPQEVHDAIVTAATPDKLDSEMLRTGTPNLQLYTRLSSPNLSASLVRTLRTNLETRDKARVGVSKDLCV